MGGTYAAGETVIAQGVRVEGEFSSEGNVTIEGEVSGTVRTAKDLRVGPAARIQADVAAENAVVAGIIHGNVTVTGRLELLESSQVVGDIGAGTLSVAAGAKLSGRISMDAERRAVAPARRGRKEEEPVVA